MIKKIIKNIVSLFKKQNIKEKDDSLNDNPDAKSDEGRDVKRDKPPDDIYPLW